ncbi:MAG: TadE family protein [Planctomycetota bacterium]
MFQSKRRSHIGRRGKQRNGTATVEMAICLPVLLTLTLGTMDLCSLFFLRETVTLAAYEGARAGVASGSTNASSLARVREFLDERGVVYTGTPATFSSPGFDSAATLEHVTVTVSVPMAGNLLLPSALYANGDCAASVTMRKEYSNVQATGT